MICNVCHKDVPKIKSEKHPTQRRFYYRNADGRMWQGNKCPDCNYKAKRFYTTHEIEDGTRNKVKVIDTNPLTKRLCRRCDERLPASCYFYHTECFPTVEIPYGGYEYGSYCTRGDSF